MTEDDAAYNGAAEDGAAWSCMCKNNATRRRACSQTKGALASAVGRRAGGRCDVGRRSATEEKAAADRPHPSTFTTPRTVPGRGEAATGSSPSTARCCGAGHDLSMPARQPQRQHRSSSRPFCSLRGKTGRRGCWALDGGAPPSARLWRPCRSCGGGPAVPHHGSNRPNGDIERP
jgi:hypothetical protein